jgi:hypothetical protein
LQLCITVQRYQPHMQQQHRCKQYACACQKNDLMCAPAYCCKPSHLQDCRTCHLAQHVKLMR